MRVTKDSILKTCYELLEQWGAGEIETRDLTMLKLFEQLKKYDFERYMGHFLHGANRLRNSIHLKDINKETENKEQHFFSKLKMD